MSWGGRAWREFLDSLEVAGKRAWVLILLVSILSLWVGAANYWLQVGADRPNLASHAECGQKAGESQEAAGIDRSGTLDQGTPIPSRASQALSSTYSLVATVLAGTLAKAG
jgi:hypothetical protein